MGLFAALVLLVVGHGLDSRFTSHLDAYPIWVNAAAVLMWVTLGWSVAWAWGALQSAQAPQSGDMPLLQAVGAMALNQLLAVLLVLQQFNTLHDLLETWSAHHLEGVAEVSIRVQPADDSLDTQRVLLSGELGKGSARLFETWLQEHPDIRMVEIAAGRALVPEAVRLANHIAERQLDTFIRQDCSSTCPLLFMAGARRVAHPDASVRLHRISSPVWSFARGRTIADDAFEQWFGRRRISPDLVERYWAAKPWAPVLVEGPLLVDTWLATEVRPVR